MGWNNTGIVWKDAEIGRVMERAGRMLEMGWKRAREKVEGCWNWKDAGVVWSDARNGLE